MEFVNVVLSFFLPDRGQPAMRFQGPFIEGVTNKTQCATQQWWKCELVITGAESRRGRTNAEFMLANNQGFQSPGSLSFLDRQGKRYLPVVTNSTQSGALWLSRGFVPGLNTNQIAAAEIHLPQTKTFHHVKARYPERPVLITPAPRGK